MGELGALFNPGMRHELEERRARAARREEEGNARDGDLRIDLESGVAVINAPGDDEPGPTSGTGPSGAEPSGAEPSGAEPSGASGADLGADDPADQAAASSADTAVAPEPLRPRGKRAMTATRR